MTSRALSPVSTATRYVAFAALATVANLAAQEAVVRTSPFATLTLSILAGTIAGFALKYVLDKLYVFDDPFESHADEARKIALYGAFSVLTTAIFWAAELAAWSMFGTSAAKYFGAVLGLAVGYAAKYALDRRFVFRGSPV